jgi:hypothetical protein
MSNDDHELGSQHWNITMKFGTKKSHEMISYNLSEIASSGNGNM